MKMRWGHDPDGNDIVWMWCPACEDMVMLSVGDSDSGSGSGWTWNGNPEAPTFNPSIKLTGAQWEPGHDFHKAQHQVETGEQTICHSFLTDGVWEFLGDCTHALRGMHVPMVELPDWMEPAPEQA